MDAGERRRGATLSAGGGHDSQVERLNAMILDMLKDIEGGNVTAFVRSEPHLVRLCHSGRSSTIAIPDEFGAFRGRR
jgi:hypothetical protein